MSVSPTTCAYWHPDEPTEIRRYKRRNDFDNINPQEVCGACNRARQRAKYRNPNYPNAPTLTRPHRSPWGDYGVLPRLTWPAPEFKL